jgi:hypothetical protein
MAVDDLLHLANEIAPPVEEAAADSRWLSEFQKVDLGTLIGVAGGLNSAVYPSHIGGPPIQASLFFRCGLRFWPRRARRIPSAFAPVCFRPMNITLPCCGVTQDDPLHSSW